MFHLYILTFLLALATASEKIPLSDFSTCMSNVEAAKTFYKDFYDNHQRLRLGFRTDRLAKIKMFLENRKLPEDCEKAFPLQDPIYYNDAIFKECGGIKVYQQGFDMTPEWDDWSDWRVCGWMMEVFTIYRSQLKHNLEVVRKCDDIATFHKLFFRVWEQCRSYSGYY